jgi:restriction endonuclease S subunit
MVLASPELQRFILEENYGFTRQALTKGMIEKIIVPLSPLAEQRRIVAKLNNLTGRLIHARAELDRVASLIKQLRMTTLTAQVNALGEPRIRLGDILEDVRYGTSKKCNYAGGSVPVLRIPNPTSTLCPWLVRETRRISRVSRASTKLWC